MNVLNLVEDCLQSVEKCFEGKIHKSGPEPRNGNVNTVNFYSSREIFESVAPSLFMINEHAIANVCLYLCFQLRINVHKKYA